MVSISHDEPMNDKVYVTTTTTTTTSNLIPTTTSVHALSSSTTITDIVFPDIRIDEKEWITRINDHGCKNGDLPKATYKQAKIPAVDDEKILYIITIYLLLLLII